MTWAFCLYSQLHVTLTPNCRPGSVDWFNGLFLPFVFEISQMNPLSLFWLVITISLFQVHHHLTRNTCLQSPTNTKQSCLYYEYPSFFK